MAAWSEHDVFISSGRGEERDLPCATRPCGGAGCRVPAAPVMLSSFFRHLTLKYMSPSGSSSHKSVNPMEKFFTPALNSAPEA